MRSICFFSSYYKGESIPFYIKYYLEELTRHFSETVFITNEKNISAVDKSFLEDKRIKCLSVKNEGYDFGMWYKAFQQYDMKLYDRVGLVNDSCILFKKLDTVFDYFNKENPDFLGLTDTYLDDYHIQSYFLLISKKAIPLMLEYFSKNGIIKELDQVIKTYEIGLSRYLVARGLNVEALYKCETKNGNINNTLINAKDLIEKGFPLIKKKIISREYGAVRWRSMVVYGFDPYPEHYIDLIKRITGSPDIDGIFSEFLAFKGIWKELLFRVNIILGRMSGAIRHNKNRSH